LYSEAAVENDVVSVVFTNLPPERVSIQTENPLILRTIASDRSTETTMEFESNSDEDDGKAYETDSESFQPYDARRRFFNEKFVTDSDNFLLQIQQQESLAQEIEIESASFEDEDDSNSSFILSIVQWRVKFPKGTLVELQNFPLLEFEDHKALRSLEDVRWRVESAKPSTNGLTYKIKALSELDNFEEHLNFGESFVYIENVPDYCLIQVDEFADESIEFLKTLNPKGQIFQTILSYVCPRNPLQLSALQDLFPKVDFDSFWKQITLFNFPATSPRLKIRNWRQFYESLKNFYLVKSSRFHNDKEKLKHFGFAIENCGLLFQDPDNRDEDGKSGDSLGRIWPYVCSQVKGFDCNDEARCSNCQKIVYHIKEELAEPLIKADDCLQIKEIYIPTEDIILNNSHVYIFDYPRLLKMKKTRYPDARSTLSDLKVDTWLRGARETEMSSDAQAQEIVSQMNEIELESSGDELLGDY